MLVIEARQSTITDLDNDDQLPAWEAFLRSKRDQILELETTAVTKSSGGISNKYIFDDGLSFSLPMKIFLNIRSNRLQLWMVFFSSIFEKDWVILTCTSRKADYSIFEVERWLAFEKASSFLKFRIYIVYIWHLLLVGKGY